MGTGTVGDTGVAEIDGLAGVADSVLEEELAALASRIAAAEARFCVMLIEVDRRGLWALAGATSCAAWLSWRCGMAIGAARERVRVAAALAELPLLTAAFQAGRLSFSQMRAITRVATPESESVWLEWAAHTPAAQIERVCAARRRQLRANHDPQSDHHDRDARPGPEVTMHTDTEGMVEITTRLHPEDAHVLIAAIQRRVMADRCDDPIGQRRAEAVMDMARADLAAGSPQVDDIPGVNALELLAHVDLAALEGQASGCAAVDGGPILDTDTAMRLACDTAITPLRIGRGEKLDVGRSRRTIPSAIRRAVTARDHGCTFPGCGRTRGLQCHHVRFWAKGGTTAVKNLVLTCRRHHRAVHHDGFNVTLPANGKAQWFRPDGSRIVDMPAPAPVTQPLRPNRVRDGWVLTPEWHGHLLDRKVLSGALEYLDHLDHHDPGTACCRVSAETPNDRTPAGATDQPADHDLSPVHTDVSAETSSIPAGAGSV